MKVVWKVLAKTLEQQLTGITWVALWCAWFSWIPQWMIANKHKAIAIFIVSAGLSSLVAAYRKVRPRVCLCMTAGCQKAMLVRADHPYRRTEK